MLPSINWKISRKILFLCSTKLSRISMNGMLKRKNIELPTLQNYDGTNIKEAVYIFFLIFAWLPLPEYYIYFNVFLCWYYYHIMHSNSSHIWPEYILKINTVGTKFIYFSLFFAFIFVLDVIVKFIAKNQPPNNRTGCKRHTITGMTGLHLFEVNFSISKNREHKKLTQQIYNWQR